MVAYLYGFRAAVSSMFSDIKGNMSANWFSNPRSEGSCNTVDRREQWHFLFLNKLQNVVGFPIPDVFLFYKSLNIPFWKNNNIFLHKKYILLNILKIIMLFTIPLSKHN